MPNNSRDEIRMERMPRKCLICSSSLEALAPLDLRPVVMLAAECHGNVTCLTFAAEILMRFYRFSNDPTRKGLLDPLLRSPVWVSF